MRSDPRRCFRALAIAVAVLAGAPCPAPAQTEKPPQAPPRTPGLLNPAISALFLLTGSASFDRQSEDDGFSLSEAEFAFQAAVDPFTRMDIYLAVPAGESPEIEEGTITTTALPGPLQVKGGRFKNAFGKWNLYHGHQFFTIDRPWVLERFFGEESLSTDGLSLSILIPNRWDLYIDSLTEVGTAREGPSFNSAERNLTYFEHLTCFFTPSSASTLEVGLSAAYGRTGPSERLLADLEAFDPDGMTGLAPRTALRSSTHGFDLTFRWRPPAMNVYRAFLWQSEILTSRRHLERLDAGTPALRPGTVSAWGGYTYLEAQFRKRWRVGGRYDRTGFPDEAGARVRAASAVVRFLPSEFQEIRLQVERIHRNQAAAASFDDQRDDTRILFQWIPIIGAHGAHKY